MAFFFSSFFWKSWQLCLFVLVLLCRQWGCRFLWMCCSSWRGRWSCTKSESLGFWPGFGHARLWSGFSLLPPVRKEHPISIFLVSSRQPPQVTESRWPDWVALQRAAQGHPVIKTDAPYNTPQSDFCDTFMQALYVASLELSHCSGIYCLYGLGLLISIWPFVFLLKCGSCVPLHRILLFGHFWLAFCFSSNFSEPDFEVDITASRTIVFSQSPISRP